MASWSSSTGNSGYAFSPWRDCARRSALSGAPAGLVTEPRWNTVRAVNRPGRVRIAWGIVLASVSLSSARVRAAGAEASPHALPGAAVSTQPDERLPTVASTPPAALPPPSADSDRRTISAAEPESLGWTLFSTLLSLGAIVALIYLTLNVGLRRLIAARGMPFARAGLVKVVERVMLDPKRALFVVHAAGDYLLIGGGGEGLSLIARLDPVEVERLLRQPASSPAQPSAFLQKLLSRRGEVPPGGRV